MKKYNKLILNKYFKKFNYYQISIKSKFYIFKNNQKKAINFADKIIDK